MSNLGDPFSDMASWLKSNPLETGMDRFQRMQQRRINRSNLAREQQIANKNRLAEFIAPLDVHPRTYDPMANFNQPLYEPFAPQMPQQFAPIQYGQGQMPQPQQFAPPQYGQGPMQQPFTPPQYGQPQPQQFAPPQYGQGQMQQQPPQTYQQQGTYSIGLPQRQMDIQKQPSQGFASGYNPRMFTDSLMALPQTKAGIF